MDDELSITFAALADPTRRAILQRLAHGTATVGALAEPFELTLPAVSKHLAVLERAGLVVKERDGVRRHCRIAASGLASASAWLIAYRRFWEANLQSLDEHLTAIQQTKGTTP